jgi:hypothetical protein
VAWHGDAGTRHGQRILAAVLFACIGAFDTLEGLSGVDDDPYVVEHAAGFSRVDVTGWSWAHVTVGALTAVVGLVVFTRHRWSVRFAVVVTVGSVVIHAVMLPFEPVWSAIVIAVVVSALRLLWLSRRPPARADDDVRSAGRPSR